MKRFITLIACIWSLSAMASIHHVNTMEQVSQYFEDADALTLAAFDIDMVLIQPADPAFQMANISRHLAIARKISKTMSVDEQIAFFCLDSIRSYPVIIESYTHFLFENLDERNIKRIAITGNLTGSFDCKDNMQQWTVDRLNLCNLSFSKSFPYIGEMPFENLPSYRGNFTLFKEGILFANGQRSVNKGEVLVEFLKRVNFAPRKIIFVDDSLDNLRNMESTLKHVLETSHIEFVGLLYSGAFNYQSPIVNEITFEELWWQRAEEAKQLVKSDEMHILPIFE